MMPEYHKHVVSDRWVATLSVLCVLVCSAGCVHQGPQAVVADRFDYNAAIGESWKTQTLLNIVRLRYLDAPIFLEVQQIVTGYNFERTGTAQLSARKMLFGAGDDQLVVGLTGRYIERPTVAYIPVSGEKLVKTLFTPIDPSMLLALPYSGIPVDLAFPLVLNAVNGKKNRFFSRERAYEAEPEFLRFVDVLQRLQDRNALSVTIPSKDQEAGTPTLSFHPELLSVQEQQELQELKEALGLNVEIETYRVAWGSRPATPDTLVFHTRSISQIQRMLGLFIDIPSDARQEVLPTPLNLLPGDDVTAARPLIHIHSGDSMPGNAYVAVRYQNRWYWIDSTDVSSKSVFLFLSMLLHLTESGEGGGPQLVIPAG